MGFAAGLASCPPWLLLLAGFGLGAMTRQSLQRLARMAEGRRRGSSEG